MARTIGECYKAPGDTLKQSVSFAPDLPSGVTLSGAATTVLSGGGGLTIASTTNDTSAATVAMTGGKAGETYELLLAGTYSDGQVRGFVLRVIVT
jgi:hypothetical protein